MIGKAGKTQMTSIDKIQKWILIRSQNLKFLLNDCRFNLFPSNDFVGRVDVYGTLPSDDGRMVIFSSCDQIYFDRFAETFIRSTILHNPTAVVHLHVVDPAPRTFKKVDEWHAYFPELSFTFEAPLLGSLPTEFRKCYYACIRFIRVLDILRSCRRPVFCLDVDSFIRGDLTSIIINEPNSDILLPLTLKEKAYRDKLSASAVFLRRTEQTSNFAFHLACRLQKHLNHKTTMSGIERQCLYRTLRKCDVYYNNLPPLYLDYDRRPESLVWAQKSDRSVEPISEALLQLRSQNPNEYLESVNVVHTPKLNKTS